MYMSVLPMLALAVLMFFPPTFGAPRQRYSIADLRDAFARPSSHKFYLPIEIAPAALLGAFKAHARNSARADGSDADIDAIPELPLDLVQQKRTTSSMEMVDPLSAAALVQESPVFSGMKRKMFWQPLGYMPASARAQHSKNSGGGRNSPQENGSNVFRYG
ncbi:bradykinin-like neuropeptide precursor [Elysia marginata]|uniref:Bradykinin-like neuropeptide n=1 Tax=Elysia marginata TaxID=1093978 RepID=A0AAV4FJL1_9GAST|nr:bradykinin-like neuropeptide precursor [Elysia marginata]